MSSLFLSAAPAPLFGSPWLALLAVLAGVAAFIAGVAAVGRWLAATHPEIPPAVRSPAPEVSNSIAPEILATIAAAVATQLGARARIAAVQPAPPTPAPSVEMLMQQWSLEGRRQIYSSHKLR